MTNRRAATACDPAEHRAGAAIAPRAAVAIHAAAAMLRAAGDPARLRLLELLSGGERCVSDLVAQTGDAMPAVSQRLGRLKASGLVVARREGKHIHYALADGHVASLLLAVLDHADHASARPSSHRSPLMSVHANHPHTHGAGCGHVAVQHDGHIDYLHDGHLHHQAGTAVEEHVIAISAANPAQCTPAHACGGHDAGHQHGPDCGHPAVPHGDHVDYLVNGHLHHVHGAHCDDHGPLQLA